MILLLTKTILNMIVVMDRSIVRNQEWIHLGVYIGSFTLDTWKVYENKYVHIYGMLDGLNLTISITITWQKNAMLCDVISSRGTHVSVKGFL